MKKPSGLDTRQWLYLDLENWDSTSVISHVTKKSLKQRETDKRQTPKAEQAKGSDYLTNLCSPWVTCAPRALRKSSPKLMRRHKSKGCPGCPSFSSCPDPQEDPQRSHQRIPHVGLPEIPRCSSESCWWIAASTSRGAASPWPTRPGRISNSGARRAEMLCGWLDEPQCLCLDLTTLSFTA